MAEDRKQKYALRAMEVFKRDGLRMSLDEIAEKMGVTKKTLYNHFSSKEELLGYCMQSFAGDLKESLGVMNSDSSDAITGLVIGVRRMGEIFHTLSPVFFFDLKKLYPEIAGAEHSTGFGSFLESITKNMKKGIKEKLFRPDLNVDLISQYFVYSMVSFFLNRVLVKADYPPAEYFRTVLDYHLNAIVTDNGREVRASLSHKKQS